MKAQENMERGCVEQGYDDLHIKLSHAIYYVKSYSKDNTKKLKNTHKHHKRLNGGK